MDKKIEVDTLTVAKIRRISTFGLEVYFPEYDAEGFIHISEIPRKYERKLDERFVVGQILAVRIISVEKGEIFASIKRVERNEGKRKLREWKEEERAKEIIKMGIKNIGRIPVSEIDNIELEALKRYGSMAKMLENALEKGAEILTKIGIGEETALEIYRIAKRKIKKKEKEVKAILEITLYQPKGVEEIRRIILKGMERIKRKGYRGEAVTIGAPRYLIRVKGGKIKELNNLLEKTISYIEREVNGLGGVFKLVEKS
ncbi:hypothetical protein B6U74_03590 [Candidatus Bathyarchaeota archaeon ex4484_205]|nr:MAG: hypothetical protein B6U74_03590 [Candidatus Bathyarchaeota archaeon ex4484_205]RLG69089.1 MAG: hypothetical protein DRN93_01050 [archaeon]